mgnify:FL=1
MTTVEIIDMDNNEQIVNGLFGHSFTIPRIGEKISCLDNKYRVVNIEHELICVGSILQTNKVTLEVRKIPDSLYT